MTTPGSVDAPAAAQPHWAPQDTVTAAQSNEGDIGQAQEQQRHLERDLRQRRLEAQLWQMADALRGSMDDGEPFEEKMNRLVATLREQQAEAAKLDAAIADNLKELGFLETKR